MNGSYQTRVSRKKRKLWAAVAFTALMIVFILAWETLKEAMIIIFGASITAFLSQPLAVLYEKRMNRRLAALAALLSLAGFLIVVLCIMLPVIVTEIISLVRELPRSVEQIKNWASHAADWLSTILPGFRFPAVGLDSGRLPDIARGTISFAGGISDVLYRFSLMIVLGYFFLCDRDRLLMRIELLVPRRIRQTTVRMGQAICRDLKAYLRGQGLIAAMVGLLSAVGLSIVGVRSSVVLGLIVGIMNMIPYFGPVIGSVPAVLMALSDGVIKALYAVGVMWLVQQIDSTLISPRIMSSVSGVSPAVVLLAIFVGAGLGGIGGMLLAMPAIMAFRTVFRVFVQRYENI